MNAAVFVLELLILVAVIVTVARRLGIAYPILLVLAGLALGFIPGAPRFSIEPDLVFVLVLPPIIYVAAFFTPLRSFRENLSTIGSLAVGLVIATAVAVAAVARVLLPGLTWPIALVLGAIVAPPDEIAATQVAAGILPRRAATILAGESLLNDATALTLYSAALAVAMGGVFSVEASATTFLVAVIGGVVIGLGVAWIIGEVRSRIRDVPVAITVSLLTPYAVFVSADRVGASGVIATVAAGLYLGRRAPNIMDADTRLAGRAVWEMVVFLLNGFVFLYTGLEVPLYLSQLSQGQVAGLLLAGVTIAATALAVRTIWIFATMMPRDRRTERPWANATVLAWSGMRGLVSLAAALAIPLTVSGGAPFPARQAVIVITLTVIVLTLVGPGLTLGLLIRRLGLGSGSDVREEEARARERMNEAARIRIDELEEVWPGHRPLLDELRVAFAHSSEHIGRQRDGRETDRELIEHREIRKNVIDAQREALLRLREDGVIDDDVRRSLERELDIEEQRLDAASA